MRACSATLPDCIAEVVTFGRNPCCACSLDRCRGGAAARAKMAMPVSPACADRHFVLNSFPTCDGMQSRFEAETVHLIIKEEVTLALQASLASRRHCCLATNE